MGNRHGHAVTTNKTSVASGDGSKGTRRARHQRHHSDESHLKSDHHHHHRRRHRKAGGSGGQEVSEDVTSLLPHHVSELQLRTPVSSKPEIDDTLGDLSSHAIFEMDNAERRRDSCVTTTSPVNVDAAPPPHNMTFSAWLRRDATPDNTPPPPLPPVIAVIEPSAPSSSSHIKITAVTGGEGEKRRPSPSSNDGVAKSGTGTGSMMRSASTPLQPSSTFAMGDYANNGNDMSVAQQTSDAAHKLVAVVAAAAEPIAIVNRKTNVLVSQRQHFPSYHHKQSLMAMSLSSDDIASYRYPRCLPVDATTGIVTSIMPSDKNQLHQEREHQSGVYNASMVFPQHWMSTPSPSSFVFDTPPQSLSIAAMMTSSGGGGGAAAGMTVSSSVTSSQSHSTPSLREEVHHLRHFMDNLLYTMDVLSDTMRALQVDVQRLETRLLLLQSS